MYPALQAGGVAHKVAAFSSLRTGAGYEKMLPFSALLALCAIIWGNQSRYAAISRTGDAGDAPNRRSALLLLSGLLLAACAGTASGKPIWIGWQAEGNRCSDPADNAICKFGAAAHPMTNLGHIGD